MDRSRLVEDLRAFLLVVTGSVLLGAPAGLLWEAIAPRVRLSVTAQGFDPGDLNSNKAFIGADGTYFLVMLGMGLLCGVLGWLLFRRSGPATVLGLVVGGSVAGLIAGSVGLLPGAEASLAAVTEGTTVRGEAELYLGRLNEGGDLDIRSAWAFAGWPAAACLGFMAVAFRRPHELD